MSARDEVIRASTIAKTQFPVTHAPVRRDMMCTETDA